MQPIIKSFKNLLIQMQESIILQLKLLYLTIIQ